MSITINTPVKDFSGVVAGIRFERGEATVNKVAPNALRYFKGKGYSIREAGDETSEFDGMKVDELRTYAAEHDIDLGGASKKADIIAAIREAGDE